ncbi:GNAT family N-acetyltransferase [Staphylococcus simiae]|uniref:GNAT family N-acetyltransferase n=1 Tax=Staphylococcus simiae TaxID=308354 RepID=UPI001A97711C|nr:GNAT family N-acetyltransferase [Staphylococcus simiae]MBO1198684.1 GNAT family N-acetyltransferase [Staphylococcus simiae]MBO1200831.1 GNAT family N-acetyltransferase [Staphylococcus simiae]MBO1203039.1 GNAT family N-acetyltransferase [Staphylococcus simiae]MBO1211310.1 GNAT family N-acetyltransferase [Staphylococcus simiae]MBO1229167.1 GNAT family N-acetyltransferase [Staphylococcus simiae]
MITIKNKIPSVNDYCELRKNAGMSPKTPQAAEKGLPNACYTVTIYDDDALIGMGRIIGDGGTAFQIVDIAVRKDYQGQGYGRTIMEHIMTYIKDVAVESTYVSLIADYPADKLYEKFGFIPTEPHSGGMYIKY